MQRAEEHVRTQPVRRTLEPDMSEADEEELVRWSLSLTAGSRRKRSMTSMALPPTVVSCD